MPQPGGRSAIFAALALAVGALVAFPSATALAGGTTNSISGVVFEDLNRDGRKQADEPALANRAVYLVAPSGSTTTTKTAIDGTYSFAGLANATYRVESEALTPRNDWVPTTTGTLFARLTVDLVGDGASADFGWRRIVRSTDLAAPISTYVGSNGLRVESFDDAVPATEIYDTVMRGTVGVEAQYVTIRFDYGNQSVTNASLASTNGVYTSYRAVVYVTYLSWLDGDWTLSHEYGHAWSLYYAYMVQQDPTLSSYLQARGLAGDSRVGSSYEWWPRELIADDYRQLLGSPAAQTASPLNSAIAPANEVPGLREFLLTTFTQPPAASPPPPPPPAPALTVTSPSVNPTPVTKSGTVSTSISADAKVTVEIREDTGALVRTLLADAARAAGSVSVKWDRKDASGRRVKPGMYTAVVRAKTATGATASADSPFAVS